MPHSLATRFYLVEVTAEEAGCKVSSITSKLAPALRMSLYLSVFVLRRIALVLVYWDSKGKPICGKAADEESFGGFEEAETAEATL